MTRNELKAAFEFIDETLVGIYSDVAFLDVVEHTTHNFPAVKKRALDNILTISDFAYYTINRLNSKEPLLP